jgi:hypothetical protein
MEDAIIPFPVERGMSVTASFVDEEDTSTRATAGETSSARRSELK